AVPGILMFLATLIFWLGRRKFIHVPPNPGGKLGLLDTLSSTLLFMTVGHLFFTAGAVSWFPESWPQETRIAAAGGTLAAISAVFLIAGLALFSERQRIQQDDGFLAIMFYTLRRFLRPGEGSSAERTERAAGSVNVRADDMNWLARSRFWGPAV